METGSEEVKLYLIVVNMIVYLDKPGESTDIRQVKEFSKGTV